MFCIPRVLLFFLIVKRKSEDKLNTPLSYCSNLFIFSLRRVWRFLAVVSTFKCSLFTQLTDVWVSCRLLSAARGTKEDRTFANVNVTVFSPKWTTYLFIKRRLTAWICDWALHVNFISNRLPAITEIGDSWRRIFDDGNSRYGECQLLKGLVKPDFFTC